MYTPGQNP
jgi:ATP-dependent RNA helicase DHX57